MEEKEYDEICDFLDEISEFVAGNGGPCTYPHQISEFASVVPQT